MPSFKSLSSLTKYIEKQITDSLSNEVADEVKKVEQKHIDSDVYDQYNPHPQMYSRRDVQGGLIDSKNIVSKVVGDTLIVTNETTVNPLTKSDGSFYNNAFSHGLDELIEYGFNSPFGSMEGRPFIKNTIDDLEKNKQHKKALQKGLKSRGIKTE